tara:strand:+ start:1746 stop:2051 length:306 start_codon:yes stop_codon:yes gene_type:complete
MDGGEKLFAVRRIAHSRRCESLQTVDATIHCQPRKADDGGDRAVHRVVGEGAGFPEPRAEAAENPLIEQRVRISVSDIENYQPNGIRPDINDREGFELIRK